MMDVDILIAGDFRFPGGTSTSIASEARALAVAGYRVGLLALATGPLAPRRPIHAEIRALDDAGLARLVPQNEPVQAQLCCLHHPLAFSVLPAVPPLVTCRHCILVVHHPAVDASGAAQYDVPAVIAITAALFGPTLWAPVGPKVRVTLENLPEPPPMTPEDWFNILDPDDFAAARARLPHRLPVIGRHSRPQASKWPGDRETFVAAYPDDPGVRVRLLGYSAELDPVVAPRPANWEVLPFGALPVRDFLGSLDYFSYFHGPDWIEAFGRSILEAMASGLVCFLPPDFRNLFGDAAVYCTPAEVLGHVRRLQQDLPARQAMAARAVETVRERFGPGLAVARVQALIGPPSVGRAAASRPAEASRCTGRILYFTSNGVGMGHLTRCMATARRMSPGTSPVVITMSKAFGVVQDEGIHVEYLPYFRSIGLDHATWTEKLTDELTAILSYHQPDVFVFDGNVPYGGMLAALDSRPDLWRVWQRRPLWRPGVGAEFLRLASAFDVVLEPGEFADPVDRGLTTASSADAFRVAPIRFLDLEEAYSRKLARSLLGLDPDRPAVLMQFGAGNNFDLRHQAETVFEMADPQTGNRDLQIVFARWRISENDWPLPAHVRLLDAFPISRYLAAFDCAVATAGYNTFHENIAAALPTLFVSNDHPEQDEQWLRAEFAALRGMALRARTEDPHQFRRKFQCLLEPQTRARLAAACSAARQANGASAAARFLEGLTLTRKRSPLAFRPVPQTAGWHR